MSEKPEFIKRLEASLAEQKLPPDTKIMIDLGKTFASSWTLFFTEGQYNLYGRNMTVAPSYMSINPTDYKELTKYNIYFNPVKNQYQIFEKDVPCGNQGHFVGDFMVKGCYLVFNPPVDECWKYAASFSNGFQPGYDTGGEWRNICEEGCVDFTFEFDDAYNNKLTMSCEDKKDCEKSIGGMDSTAYYLDRLLKDECYLMRDTLCSDTIGGQNSKLYQVPGSLDNDCSLFQGSATP